MVTCFESVLFTSSSMSGSFLNSFIWCLWTVATGPLFALARLVTGLSGISDKDPWATSFSDLASFHRVVVSRRDVGVRKWTRWLREDQVLGRMFGLA